MEQQNEVEDPKQYEEDRAEEGEGGVGVEGSRGGEGEGREQRGGGGFSLHSPITFPDRFTPLLIKKKKKSKGRA